MTGEEKRRLLKEQYKKDLKKRKEFLNQVRNLKKMKGMNDAVSGIVSGLEDVGKADEWIDKLNEESSMTEARLEMALDDAQAEQERLEALAKEAEMEKFSAEQMVKKMKMEMGLLNEEEEPEEEAKIEESAEAETQEIEEAPEDQEDKPDKTLGDF